MAMRALADDMSLLQAALLGTGAGLVGASLSWFLIGSQLSAPRQTDTPARQTISVESPAAISAAIPTASPSQEATAIAALPSFYLQVAAYRHEDGARESAARLQALGFEVEVQKDSEYHRLLVGPLESRDAVSRTSDRLDQVLQSSTNMRRTIPGPWMTVQPSQNSDL
jgi:cell division septation protein DedD